MLGSLLGGVTSGTIPDFTGTSGATFAGESFGDIGGAAGDVRGIGTAAKPTSLGTSSLLERLLGPTSGDAFGFTDTLGALGLDQNSAMSKLKRQLLFMRLLGEM